MPIDFRFESRDQRISSRRYRLSLFPSLSSLGVCGSTEKKWNRYIFIPFIPRGTSISLQNTAMCLYQVIIQKHWEPLNSN